MGLKFRYSESRFTSAIWVLIKIGLAACVVPTLLYFLAQVLPAILTTSSGAWVK